MPVCICPQLFHQLEASLGFMRPCLKTKHPKNQAKRAGVFVELPSVIDALYVLCTGVKQPAVFLPHSLSPSLYGAINPAPAGYQILATPGIRRLITAHYSAVQSAHQGSGKSLMLPSLLFGLCLRSSCGLCPFRLRAKHGEELQGGRVWAGICGQNFNS